MWEKKRLAYGENRLMQLIWEHGPLRSGELAELCLEQFGWKKSTTYTMLKRLEDKGYAKNEQATVSALVSRREARAEESAYVVEQSFAGSLPGFLVSFLDGRTISRREAEELKRLIDEHQED